MTSLRVSRYHSAGRLITIAILLAVVVVLYLQWRSISQLRQENTPLRDQASAVTPEDSILRATPAATEAVDMERLEKERRELRLLRNEVRQLREQVSAAKTADVPQPARTSEPDSFSFGVRPNRIAGSFGNVYGEHLSILAITNTTGIRITMAGQAVRWEKRDGGTVTDLATLWNGTSPSVVVQPNEVAQLPFEVPRDARAFQVSFRYDEHDGRSGLSYATPWVPNLPGATNAALPHR